MSAKINLLVSALLLFSGIKNLNAQTIEILSTDAKISIRGLSVVTNKIGWVSGTEGKLNCK